MTTIKDYAKEHRVSYEAVRKQLVRFSKDLDGHIFKQDRTQYLDDYAVQFLTDRRKESPVIVLNETRDEEIQKLQSEVDQLRSQLIKAQSLLIESQQKQIETAELKAKCDLLLTSSQESEKQIAELQEQKNNVVQQFHEAESQILKLTEERDAAVKDAQSYEQTWFGLYRKTSK